MSADIDTAILFGTPRDRRSLPDMIAETLLSAINEGRLTPGEQLPIEIELAKQLGVGRTSLREAIQKLKAFGVLEVRKGVGTFIVEGNRMEPVHSFVKWCAENEFEVTELFEARMSLEIAAAGLAAERATSDDIARLHAASQAHRSAAEIDALIDTDERFHDALVLAAHNSLINQLYSMLVPGLREFRRMSLAIPASAHRSGTTHDAIANAIASHDPVASRRAAVTHLWTLYSSVGSAAKTTSSKNKGGRGIADKRAWFFD